MKEKFILQGKYTLKEIEDIIDGEALDIVNLSK